MALRRHWELKLAEEPTYLPALSLTLVSHSTAQMCNGSGGSQGASFTGGDLKGREEEWEKMSKKRQDLPVPS